MLHVIDLICATSSYFAHSFHFTSCFFFFFFIRFVVLFCFVVRRVIYFSLHFLFYLSAGAAVEAAARLWAVVISSFFFFIRSANRFFLFCSSHWHICTSYTHCLCVCVCMTCRKKIFKPSLLIGYGYLKRRITLPSFSHILRFPFLNPIEFLLSLSHRIQSRVVYQIHHPMQFILLIDRNNRVNQCTTSQEDVVCL